MFNLRLRQAETALAEGRLNEAARLAEQPGVREHRDTQRLLTRLVNAFVDRGREHFQAGRFDHADADCREAKMLAGEQPSIAALASEIAAARREAQKTATRKQRIAAEVGQEIARGELALGEKLLDGFKVNGLLSRSLPGEINDQIAVSRERIEATSLRARREVNAGHTRESVTAILELQKLSPSHPELAELIDQVTTPVVSRLWLEIEAARLDRVDALIESVRPLIVFDPELTEACRVIRSAKEINKLLGEARYHEASLRIRKMARLLGNVAWLQELAEKVTQAADLEVDIQSSPLSLLESSARESMRSEQEFPTMNSPVPGIRTTPLPEQMVLQIDGIGSTLLMRQPSMSIGSAARSTSCDVALTGFPGKGSIIIDRSSGRYRITAFETTDVTVNDHHCLKKFLTDGDAVRVGHRCRFRFRRPTADVPSAVLELNGTRLPRPDIRSIVLFDETMIVGPGRSSHLVARDLDQPLILFVRNGVLYGRSGLPNRAQRFASDGTPPGTVPLELNTPMNLGGTRVTVLPFLT